MLVQSFSTQKSYIHTIDPRLRLLLALTFSLLCVSIASFKALLPLFCLALLLLLLSNPPAALLLKRIASVNLFLLFLWLFTPFTTSGTAIGQLGPFTLTEEGVELTLLVTAKANVLAISFIALLATIPTRTLGHALHALHCPSKLTFMLLFSERSFYLLFDQWQALREATKLRCFTVRFTLHSYKTIASLLAILIIRSVDQAKRSFDALRIRGFNGVFFSGTSFHLKKRDILFTLILLPIFLLSLALELGLTEYVASLILH
ncbi:MAG: energy-coupling factor transporter transmembrane protein EcfT [Desulfovibrio sp.]|nr:energy-coupling factor transporter transmembrane protein EcfT [Desulfovibrio sp.]